MAAAGRGGGGAPSHAQLVRGPVGLRCRSTHRPLAAANRPSDGVDDFGDGRGEQGRVDDLAERVTTTAVAARAAPCQMTVCGPAVGRSPQRRGDRTEEHDGRASDAQRRGEPPRCHRRRPGGAPATSAERVPTSVPPASTASGVRPPACATSRASPTSSTDPVTTTVPSLPVRPPGHGREAFRGPAPGRVRGTGMEDDRPGRSGSSPLPAAELQLRRVAAASRRGQRVGTTDGPRARPTASSGRRRRRPHTPNATSRRGRRAVSSRWLCGPQP